MLKLTIELVPSTSWFTNVRSEVSNYTWDIIRKDVYRKSNYKCEICGGKGTQWPVECHEIWEYDDNNLIQKLKGLIALCPNCHKVKHIGLTSTRGREEYVSTINHFSKVNNISIQETDNYIKEAFKLYVKRSQYLWKLDLNFLKTNYSNFSTGDDIFEK